MDPQRREIRFFGGSGGRKEIFNSRSSVGARF